MGLKAIIQILKLDENVRIIWLYFQKDIPTFIKNSDISKKQNNPKTNNKIYNVFLSVKQKYHILKMITARLLTKWHLILKQQIPKPC